MSVDITIVAAVTRDGGIGRRGKLLYRIGADMRHFKEITMGHPLIMGRRTYESLPNGPLPGRLNIVMTRHADLVVPEGAVVAHDIQEATRLAARAGNEAMVIGGGEIYQMFMPLAFTMHITEIDAPAPEDTDTWLPRYDFSVWRYLHIGDWVADPASGLSYRFLSLRRR